MQEKSNQPSLDWKRPVWLSLLVAASVAFSLSFACATPFAAFCAVAACTLPRRDAYYLTGAVWLANQGIGFAFLHYDWTASTLAWGAAVGLAALLTTLVARLALVRLNETVSVVRNAIVFLAAFVANEVMLIAFSLVLGGIENFTPAIQVKIFALNAIAWVGLFVLHWAGTAVGIASPVRQRGPLIEAEG